MEKMSETNRKRACLEWRRARSRTAARSRRERERQLFQQLAQELPLPLALSSRLDKASILRLSLTYLRLLALQETTDLPRSSAVHPVYKRSPDRPWKSVSPLDSDPCGYTSAMESCDEKVLESALGGFLLLVSHSGQIIYSTDGVSTHTGINQMDLIGQNLFHFTHPCDLKEVRDIISSKAGLEDQRECDIHLRIKCNLTSHGRSGSLKSASWKVLHCTGIRKCSPAFGYLVLLCRSLPEFLPSIRDTSLNSAAFLTKHTLDMRFSYCQPRVSEFIGYTEHELLGQSVYQFYHVLDCQNMQRAHFNLISKGKVSTGMYRLLVKPGGFVWMETDATVVYNSHTGDPQSVICVNYVLSDMEQPDVVLSLKQKEYLKPCSSGAITAPSFVHLAGGYGGCSAFTVEKSIPTPLCDERGRSEVLQAYPLIETLLEWDSTKNSQKSTQDLSEEDLDTLAPYIPMDGEDFPLSSISETVKDMTEPGQQESLCILPCHEMDSGAWPDSLSPSPGQSHHRPLTPCAPSQTQSVIFSHCSSLRSYMLKDPPYWDGMKSAYSKEFLHTSSNKKQEVYNRKRHWSDGHFLYSRDQHSCCNSCSPGQPTASQWKKVKPNYTQIKKCDPLWWSPGGLTDDCCQLPLGFVPWAPQYRKISSSPPAQDKLPITNQLKGESTWSVLPVLSHLECEVNAPLGPTSCLLHGAEILSVLDQAAFRLCS